MKTVPTFTATIYAGFRVGRTADPNPRFHTMDDAREVIQKYVDDVGLCVTIKPTAYIYTLGGEDGVEVGLINYPRFPKDYSEIRRHAIALAQILQGELEQRKVTVVLPNETIMLGDEK